MSDRPLSQPVNSVAPVACGLPVRTGLRAGATAASDELLEATRKFLQSLLNALPPAANTTLATTSTNKETPTAN